MSADAYESGLRGEIDAVEEALRAAPDGPWAVALRALRYFTLEETDETELPSPGQLRALGPAPSALRAGLHAVRGNALRFDGRAAGAVAEALEELAPESPWTLAGRGWVRLLRGEPISDDALQAAGQAARGDGCSDLVVETTALRGLGAASAGDLESALRLARQASRMARTESIPQAEHFAHLALARVRRLCGKPHLSTRILAGLGRVATAPWRPWLAWELLFAQGRPGAGKLAAEAPAPAALAALLEAARRGEGEAFDAARERAATRAAGFAPFAEDLALAELAIDPSVEADRLPEPLASFCQGVAPHEPPRGLAGLCGAEAEAGEHVVWIAAPMGRPARRVLAAGLELAHGALGEGALIEGEKQIRTHSAIAVLVLAGDGGLEEDALFSTLYGFPYEPERHQAVRGVLYGRVKKRLADHAELERSDGRVRLAPRRDLLVCDPRCTPPPELRILAVLARRREAAPKDVASALGIPLRTAQDALRRLSEDGALRSERAGRGLHYILEDTTYSEPTRRRRA